MSSWPALLLTAALMVAGSACGGDGDGTRGTSGATAVEGTVRTGDDTPVEGALVQVASPDDPTAVVPDIALYTDREGHYRWDLGPGNYEITISKDGFRTATKPVTLQRGSIATLDFTLEQA